MSAVESNLDEAYVMAHRLEAFLAHALPQHPEYDSHLVAPFRVRSDRKLTWIRERKEELAFKIDEEQLNIFIQNDFDPGDDDSTVGTIGKALEEPQMDEPAEEPEWECFSGWHFDVEDTPAGAETDTSSHDLSTESDPTAGSQTPPVKQSPEKQTALEKKVDRHVQAQFVDDDEEEDEPEPYLDDYDSESDDEYYGAPRFELDEDHLETSILPELAEEKVLYESDSDAIDSWAQDGLSGFSCASSGTGITCDPARLAFREIMNHVPRDKLLATADGSTEDWARFSFASIRRR